MERRREWAASAATRSRVGFDRAHQIAEGIPFGQPILVGHHSERRARRDQARIEAGMIVGHENAQKASRHEAVADGIERQLATTIFSDDEDAIERLQEKITTLESTRDQWKAENAAFRKEHAAELRAMGAYDRSCAVPHASYSLTNIGARIREAKRRIDEIQRTQRMQEAGERGTPRVMASRYGGTCPDCGLEFQRGDTIYWFRVTREAVCEACGKGGN